MPFQEKDGKKSKISVVTLGCSKNLVDSELLLGQLKLNNALVVDDVEEAETVVINTCGFVEAAKQESIDAIVEAVERKSQGKLKKVVVMGCLSERYAKELRKEIPEVDAYFGSDQIEDVLRELGVDYRKELLGERSLTAPSHVAYLKVSEGCDRTCSFCAIPLMRGNHRTKSMEQVLRETEWLALEGVREAIVIGQDTTSYGIDLYGERRLAPLLRRMTEVEGIEWIRLMYAYPAGFPMEVLEVYADSPKICRYLDLPLQHASDSVLKSMRRAISGKRMRDLLERIRKEVPNLALRTTLIVGYPTESERDFRILYDFVKEMRFHRLGVFTYSREEGTSAETLGDPVPSEVKEERRNVIMELQREISTARNTGLIGTKVKILVDRIENGFAVGRTEWDAPEIDQEVYVRNDEPLRVGNFYDVEVVDAIEYDIYGRTMP